MDSGRRLISPQLVEIESLLQSWKYYVGSTSMIVINDNNQSHRLAKILHTPIA